ncbi:hypothetical protein KCP70_06500 [Salmonella enterica subsp. enterica]|nr:hypothetical protein KCP70_06500 [Salmonella enterica subsp. enterica]
MTELTSTSSGRGGHINRKYRCADSCCRRYHAHPEAAGCHRCCRVHRHTGHVPVSIIMRGSFPATTGRRRRRGRCVTAAYSSQAQRQVPSAAGNCRRLDLTADFRSAPLKLLLLPVSAVKR